MKKAQASELVVSLFESWAVSLLRYAARATGSRESAEDIVQEAFLALYLKLREDKRIENPKGWTLRVVRNQIRKHERNQKLRREVGNPEGTLEMLPSVCQQEQPRVGEFDDITQLLSVLSQREEEVILLRMQALKYREIASQLGISAKSVATLLARALRKMQKLAKAKVAGERVPTHVEDDVPKTLQ